jgi:spore coat polysaccharide biosynthesis predicted glycosyltransferase SpsG/RimJ/RimL family protein N-acetyltransferase
MGVIFFTETTDGRLERCEATAEALTDEWRKCSIVVDTGKAANKADFAEHILAPWLNGKPVVEKIVSDIEQNERVDAIVIDAEKSDTFQQFEDFDKPLIFIDNKLRLEHTQGLFIALASKLNGRKFLPFSERRVCLGLAFFPLKREFWNVEPIGYSDRKGILVALGDSALPELTQNVVNIIGNLSDEPVTLISNEQRFIGVSSVIAKPDALTMMLLLSGSKLVVTSCGTVIAEAARTGTPAVAIALNAHEEEFINIFYSAGFLRYAGVYTQIDVFKRLMNGIKWFENGEHWSAASGTGRFLIDGAGAKRVAQLIISEINEKFNCSELHIDQQIDGFTLKHFTNLTIDEHLTVIKSRNSEAVIKSSLTRNRASYETQKRFSRALQNSSTTGYWLVSFDEKHIGVIGLSDIDRYICDCELSYYKLVDCGGKGVGLKLINIAVKLAFEKLKLWTVRARSYEDNTASCLSLERAGFSLKETKTVAVEGEYKKVRLYAADRA